MASPEEFANAIDKAIVFALNPEQESKARLGLRECQRMVRPIYKDKWTNEPEIVCEEPVKVARNIMDLPYLRCPSCGAVGWKETADA